RGRAVPVRAARPGIHRHGDGVPLGVDRLGRGRHPEPHPRRRGDGGRGRRLPAGHRRRDGRGDRVRGPDRLPGRLRGDLGRLMAPTAPPPPALLVRGLTKRYGPVLALDDTTLEVASGTVHALVGANGSGKSTLIKVLAGVERGEPGGVVEVLGRPLAV